MVKGMDKLDVSDLNMGNGQATTNRVENNGQACKFKDDGRKKPSASLDILDTKCGEISLQTIGSPVATTNNNESFDGNDFKIEDPTGLKQQEPDSLKSVQNEKVEEHFGRSITLCNDSLKDLLLLHLDVMEQQQSKLFEKDRIIAQLRADKDQLESRLTRMERRMAVKRKHSTEDISEETSSIPIRSKPTTSQTKTRLSLSSLQPATKRPRFSLSSITVTSRQGKDCGLGTYLLTESTYLHKEMPGDAPHVNIKQETKEDNFIVVPNFRVMHETRSRGKSPTRKLDKAAVNDVAENVDDETFFRRHQKLELDEKRRKRWDIQHSRHQRQQENLKGRQKEREVQRKTKGIKITGENKKQVINSLMPDPEKLIAIEVSNQVPVSAFGSRLPAIQQKEFNLPWFDIAKREVQLRQMKERREKREKDKQRKRSRRKNTRRW